AERLAEIRGLRHTAVLYEAPGRLTRLLADLASVGGGERKVVVARELTKIHETLFRRTLREALAYYEREPARGEVVVVVGGAEDTESAPGVEDEALAVARELLAAGGRPSAVARELARRTGVSRN